MAHRDAEYHELCTLCDEPAARPCVRCGAIYCADHAPADERRCDDCEAAYRRRAKVATSGWSRLPELVIFATAAGAIGAALAGLGELCIAVVVVGVLGFKGVPDYETTRPSRESRLRALRRSFLAERTRLLEPGDD